MKGILFREEVWQAERKVLEQYGEAQTRRLSGLGDINMVGSDWAGEPTSPDQYEFNDFSNGVATFIRTAVDNASFKIGVAYHCKPRFQVGEVVYRKEAWAYHGCTHEFPGDISTAHIEYLADRLQRDIVFDSFDKMMASVPEQNIKYPANYQDLDEYDKWLVHSDLLHRWWQRVSKGISPLFMPAWAARDFLRITAVRAERLNSIRVNDCLAEGINIDLIAGIDYDIDNELWKHGQDKIIKAYKELWDSINKEYTWDKNPWCFVYTFKKIDKPVSLVV